MSSRRRRSAGVTLAEVMAAFAIVSVGLTLSMHVIFSARDVDELTEAAELRLLAAERALEQTLSLPFEKISARSMKLAPGETGGRTGWSVEVDVHRRPDGLKEIKVTVRGEGRRSTLWALARREAR